MQLGLCHNKQQFIQTSVTKFGCYTYKIESELYFHMVWLYLVILKCIFFERNRDNCFLALDFCYNSRLATETLGRVAQSVEQRIENPRVTGSIPVPATN